MLESALVDWWLKLTEFSETGPKPSNSADHHSHEKQAEQEERQRHAVSDEPLSLDASRPSRSSSLGSQRTTLAAAAFWCRQISIDSR